MTLKVSVLFDRPFQRCQGAAESEQAAILVAVDAEKNTLNLAVRNAYLQRANVYFDPRREWAVPEGLVNHGSTRQEGRDVAKGAFGHQ
jgi:hypothetical protein